jgi:signal transduction histidine kinase
VRALLLLSQSETGQLVLQKTSVDLAEVARDIVDQFQIPAEGHGVSLSVDAPASCVISADRIQIERLLSNLLSNAVKYTPADGRVHVTLSASGAEARLVVEDTGVGIPAEHLPRIFERFYRVSPAGPEKGLGLGLSFVAWIVKAHGGTVQVESEVGRGTRFTVTLPVGDAGVRPVPDAALPGVKS